MTKSIKGTQTEKNLLAALGLAPLLALWSAYHYLCAGRTLELGVQRAEEYVGNELPQES